MNSFPFQSNYIGDDEQGNPIYDRAIGADFYRQMWSLFFTNGIFANPSTNFQVFAHNAMTIRVNPGCCFINGVTSIENENTDLTLDVGDELRDRVDSIVLRADFSQNRRVTIEVKKNTTTLTRNSDIFELCLAQINIPRRSTSINQSAILDTRLNKNLCGVVTNSINIVDTTTIFNQYNDYWTRKRIANEREWNEQMNNQYDEFYEALDLANRKNNEIKENISSWFENVKMDITRLKGLDINNYFDLKGVNITNESSTDGTYSIQKRIYMLNNKKLAEVIEKIPMSFLVTLDFDDNSPNERFITILREYEKDGISIKKEVTIEEYKTENGNWKMEVR